MQADEKYLEIVTTMKILNSFCSAVAAFALATVSTQATVYTDATNDSWGAAEVDISSVVVTNDGNNVIFNMILAQGATNGISSGANYLFGIQVVGAPQGQTNINATTSGVTAGNPWGKRVGISSGMNYFIGCYPNGTGYSGGAQLYHFTNGFGWSGQIGSTATIVEVTNPPIPSIKFSIPLSALGLGVGSNFNFDVWTSYGSPGGQGAYDALDSSVRAPVAPYTPTNYDSATAAGSTLSSYTVLSGVAYSAQVTFQLNMSVAIQQGLFDPSFGDYVEARGSFDGWPVGDHLGLLLTNVVGTSNYVGVLVTNSIPLGGSVDYKFVIDSGTQWEGNVGPNGAQNRSFTLTNISQTLPYVFWNNVTNANLNFPVQFTVDMSAQNAYGNFVPGNGDTIYVNGDWDWNGDALQLVATADPLIYTGTVALAYSPGTTINYKYAMNQGINASDWETNGVGPNGANNRQFVLNTATNLPTDFFNNINNFGGVSVNSVTGGEVFNWTAGPNIRLQSSTNLLSGWTDVPNTQGQSAYTNMFNGPMRFFRLIGP